LYPYLLILNPDGTPHVLFPDGEAAEAVEDFVHPPGQDDFLGLESEGFVSLVLVASKQPLPRFDLWRPVVDGRAWTQLQPAGAWLFQGQVCEPLSRDRASLGERAPQIFADLCHLLKGRPGIAGVRALAVGVRANPDDRASSRKD
jgi:hypothetical protein